MKILSKALFPYARRALNTIAKDQGEDRALIVCGAWIGTEKNLDGDDVAALYTVRDRIDFDAVEEGLKYFVGDIKESQNSHAIAVVGNQGDQWKKQQTAIQQAIRQTLQKTGMTTEDSMVKAMILASEFGAVKKGSIFGHVHTEDVAEIAESALNAYESVVMNISRGGTPLDWDGDIEVEILETKAVKRDDITPID